MTRNKPRLLLALYARPKHPNSYHYALLISPKLSKHQLGNSAVKHHALNTLQIGNGEATQPWRYERSEVVDVEREHRLLVCVVVAKVLDRVTLERALASVPVYQRDDPDKARAETFDCIAWARAALENLLSCKAVAGLISFDTVEREALRYLERKKSEGRWAENVVEGVPTLDLLQLRELVP